MSKDITFDVGDVLLNLKRFGEMGERAAKAGREAVGTELLRLSEYEVPLDEGTLAGTGVNEDMGDEHVVGYNTPYAARLHENPGYNFQNGRKGKYLEDPIKENKAALGKIFGIRAKEELKT